MLLLLLYLFLLLLTRLVYTVYKLLTLSAVTSHPPGRASTRAGHVVTCSVVGASASLLAANSIVTSWTSWQHTTLYNDNYYYLRHGGNVLASVLLFVHRITWKVLEWNLVRLWISRPTSLWVNMFNWSTWSYSKWPNDSKFLHFSY